MLPRLWVGAVSQLAFGRIKVTAAWHSSSSYRHYWPRKEHKALMMSSAHTSFPPVASEDFATRYFARLGLDPAQLDASPTVEKLRILQEAHLGKIPFENLSQHGCTQPAMLNVESTAIKILDTNRGGFCFELNGLLAHFLTELGYQVCRVPSYVGVEGNYGDMATHMVLIVTCPSLIDMAAESSMWLVDVGFGEPPLHPLSYSTTIWDQEQVTPEGMQSKLIREVDESSGEEYVHLLWYKAETNAWMRRLKWKYNDALLGSQNGPPLESFAPGLAAVLPETSVFGQKVISCLHGQAHLDRHSL